MPPSDSGDCSQGAINETSSWAVVGVRGGLISYAQTVVAVHAAQTHRLTDPHTGAASTSGFYL